MNKIKQFFRTSLDIVHLIVSAVVCLALFVGILKVFEPLWPVTSLLFAAFWTVCAFAAGRWMGWLSILGIVTYLASWAIVSAYGRAIGLSVWGAGFMVWFIAGMKGFTTGLEPYHRVPLRT